MVTWSDRQSTHEQCLTDEEVIQLAENLHIKRPEPPPLMEVWEQGSGRSLGVGLGREESVLTYQDSLDRKPSIGRVLIPPCAPWLSFAASSRRVRVFRRGRPSTRTSRCFVQGEGKDGGEDVARGGKRSSGRACASWSGRSSRRRALGQPLTRSFVTACR